METFVTPETEWKLVRRAGESDESWKGRVTLIKLLDDLNAKVIRDILAYHDVDTSSFDMTMLSKHADYTTLWGREYSQFSLNVDYIAMKVGSIDPCDSAAVLFQTAILGITKTVTSMRSRVGSSDEEYKNKTEFTKVYIAFRNALFQWYELRYPCNNEGLDFLVNWRLLEDQEQHHPIFPKMVGLQTAMINVESMVWVPEGRPAPLREGI